MSRRLAMTLLVAALAIGSTAGAVAAPSSRTLTASSARTVQTKIEAIRHSLDGTRNVSFARGAYANKNVIIIQVESLNEFIVNRKVNGKEVTPNLNKLIKESYYWPNCYSQIGMGNTADAEFIVNTSMLAPGDQACAVKYANRKLTSLPKMVGTLGYTSFTIHPNKVTYWNRCQLYKALGFSAFYDRSFFKGYSYLGQFGPSDQALFEKTMTVLKTLKKQGKKYYGQVITLSSHGPFNEIPKSKEPWQPPSTIAGSFTAHYMSEESYTDAQLGTFVKNLKSAGMWDDSIIIIYGDHTAMLSNTLSGADARAAKMALGRNYNQVDRQRIPLVIHLPGETTGTVLPDVAGQVDVLPTVADLLGADISGLPHVGKSLFTTAEPLVPLQNYLRGGAFFDYRALILPAKGSAKAAAFRVSDGAGTGIGAVDKSLNSVQSKLRGMCDDFLMSLPTFNAGAKGWIPDPIARKAAAKYGFTQH